MLFFGLCERGQPLLTRVLHGPSFGCSHAMFMSYLFALLAEGTAGTEGFPGNLWSFWLSTAPCILHWADGMLNFHHLLKAYSPPMERNETWETASHLGPALYFAFSRMFLRAWSASVGYLVFEELWRLATQPWKPWYQWDWSVQQLLQVNDIKEVLPLASTIMAYTAFTHRLFVTPEPEKKS